MLFALLTSTVGYCVEWESASGPGAIAYQREGGYVLHSDWSTGRWNRLEAAASCAVYTEAIFWHGTQPFCPPHTLAQHFVFNPLTPTVAIWVQLLSVRVPWCQKLQMMA